MLHHVAIHEAGHAVVGVALGFRLRYVSIHPTCVAAWAFDHEDDTRPEPEEITADKAASRASRVHALAEDAERFESLLGGIRALLGSEERIADYLVMSR
jgi:hypothetical protein